MYAVYGLKEDQKTVEKFLGYIPAVFFDQFDDPSIWSIEVVRGPEGIERVGRLCGRAFFFSVSNLKADPVVVRQYMEINSPLT